MAVVEAIAIGSNLNEWVLHHSLSTVVCWQLHQSETSRYKFSVESVDILVLTATSVCLSLLRIRPVVNTFDGLNLLANPLEGTFWSWSIERD